MSTIPGLRSGLGLLVGLLAIPPSGPGWWLLRNLKNQVCWVRAQFWSYWSYGLNYWPEIDDTIWNPPSDGPMASRTFKTKVAKKADKECGMRNLKLFRSSHVHLVSRRPRFERTTRNVSHHFTTYIYSPRKAAVKSPSPV